MMDENVTSGNRRIPTWPSDARRESCNGTDGVDAADGASGDDLDRVVTMPAPHAIRLEVPSIDGKNLSRA